MPYNFHSDAKLDVTVVDLHCLEVAVVSSVPAVEAAQVADQGIGCAVHAAPSPGDAYAPAAVFVAPTRPTHCLCSVDKRIKPYKVSVIDLQLLMLLCLSILNNTHRK